MFREMRRNRQELSLQQCLKILNRADSGVLAVCGDDGYPYAVPLNFIFDDNKIYFHCAVSGHKLDAINADDKVSFCIVDKDEIVAEKLTAFFRSVIVFGKASVVNDDNEKRRAAQLLCEKYAPDFKTKSDEEIASSFKRFNIVRIDCEHISGKQAKELIGSAEE